MKLKRQKKAIKKKQDKNKKKRIILMEIAAENEQKVLNRIF